MLRDGSTAALRACGGGSTLPGPAAPGLPLQTVALAQQAPLADLNGRLHIGVDVAAPSRDLRVLAVHGDTPHSYLAGIPFTCEHQIRPDQLRGPSRIR